MTSAALKFLLLVELIAFTHFSPSLAQRGRRGVRKGPRRCLSDRIIKTSDKACCAFDITTRNSTNGPTTSIKVVGRIVPQDKIQEKFILTAANGGLDVDRDGFLTQAAGQDFLFVCPPGTQLLPEVEAQLRAPGARRRKMIVSRVLRLLRAAAGFFGVRRPPPTTPPPTTPPPTTPPPAEEDGRELARAAAPAAHEAVAAEEATANKEELDNVASEVMQDMISQMLDNDSFY